MLAQSVPLSPRLLRLPPRPVRQVVADAVIDSDALLKGQRELLIRHDGQLYRLRHTSNGKLILTK